MQQSNDLTKTDDIIVVGVGASAGGLEAFQALLRGLPENSELIIVLVQHLDPDHESLMPELISAKTKAPVHSVTNNMEIEPGHIYLIPPGYEMVIEGRQLKLKEFEIPRGLRRPIDRFFVSLAEAHGENAIAVVLSGTGSDGADGAREIKGAGGLVFVQDPHEARYDGMPQSVLDSGSADVVAKAEEIIEVIRDYFDLRIGISPDLIDDDAFIERIMRHVRFRTGHDFVDYKQGTLLRRIAVRMSVLNLSAPADYLRVLVENKDEADLLFQDLLINVTSFFRDPDHFNILQRDIIPQIVENTKDQGEIRVWVAGCSSGEEAYSVGILLAEEVSRINSQCRIVVFATDIDEQALAHARLGRYTDSIAKAIPVEFLERYFHATNSGFEVGSQLREIVRFSRHSFIKDPPFSKMNLICCRNVMIYMKDNLQEIGMRVFHYALNEDGYMFLGPSETPNTVNEYFEEVSSRSRIFRRLPGPARTLNLGVLSGASRLRIPKLIDAKPPVDRRSDVDQFLLDNHIPAYLHVDRSGGVVYASENATKYLAVRAGRMKTSLFDMISPVLETTLRRMFRSIEKDREKQIAAEFQGAIHDAEARLLLTLDRLPDETILLVIKDQLDLRDDLLIPPRGVNELQDDYIRQIETELDEAKQVVRTTVEELETSNEELKSSNEEMMSMNEELQSGNEELSTINDELQEKVRELNQANRDLNNFVDSARVATVFLNEGLTLRSYTPEAEAYFSFVPSDIGRKLEDLNAIIDQEKLLALCKLTAADRNEREAEFVTKDSNIYLNARIMPYSPDDRDTHGVVFTLVDVTELNTSLHLLEKQKELAERRLHEVDQMYQTSPNAVCLISPDMKYVRLNEKMAEINGTPVDLHLNRTVRDIMPTVADDTERLVRQVLDTGEAIRGVRVTGNTISEPDNQRIWQSDWDPFYSDGELVGVTVHIRDITAEVELSEKQPQLMRELEHRMKNMLANVTSVVNRAEIEITDDQEVYQTLKRRIVALSNTNALLTADHWSSARLADIFHPETVAVYGEDRVQLSGPDVSVNAQATLALGMVVHELATNCAKYGAFSQPEGNLSLEWFRVNDKKGDRLVLHWTETGGPAVSPPEKSGFGTKLIEATLRGRLGGGIRTQWHTTGVSHVIEMDYEEVCNLYEP